VYAATSESFRTAGCGGDHVVAARVADLALATSDARRADAAEAVEIYDDYARLYAAFTPMIPRNVDLRTSRTRGHARDGRTGVFESASTRALGYSLAKLLVALRRPRGRRELLLARSSADADVAASVSLIMAAMLDASEGYARGPRPDGLAVAARVDCAGLRGHRARLRIPTLTHDASSTYAVVDHRRHVIERRGDSPVAVMSVTS